jgi:hypothetical protein
MSTPFQDFDSAVGPTKYSGELKLGGRVWKIRHSDDVPFEIVKRLMSQQTPNPDDPPELQAEQAKEIVMQTGPFFRATIVPEEVDSFMEMFTGDDSPVTIGKLKPLMEYVSKVVFTEDGVEDRPTKPSRRSQPGRLTTGGTSAGNSLVKATPRKASAS